MDVVVRLTPGDAGDAAHALLHEVVAGRVGRAVEVAREPTGRPVLVGAPGWHVSLSHTVGCAAVVVSARGPVGVDVEGLRPVRAVELARRWFTAPEADWVRALPADRRDAGFLRLWTRKEAVGKARGTGLSRGGLRQPVLADLDGDRLRALPGAPGVVLAGPTAPAGFVLAVACLGAPAGLPVRVVHA